MTVHKCPTNPYNSFHDILLKMVLGLEFTFCEPWMYEHILYQSNLFQF